MSDMQDLARRLAPTIWPYIAQRLGSGIGCRVYNSAAITLTTGIEAALTFDSERYDDTGMHSTSSNTARITITTPGVYLFGGHVQFVANATGQRYIAVMLNGATYLGIARNTPLGGGVTTDLAIATAYQCVAGDYVTLQAYQSSGGNLNVAAGGSYSPEFWAQRLC